MIEVLLCSIVTILPDFLVRRFVQGKRVGREITLYSVWYELRYGITACLALTIVLLTLILYYHPSTTSAVSFFRTVPILPEGSGRVEEIYVGLRDEVKAGDKIFKLDSSEEEAALDTRSGRLSEIDAAFELAKADLAAADAHIQEAQSAYQQAADELATKTELQTERFDCCAARDREAAERRRRPPGLGGRGAGQQTVGRGARSPRSCRRRRPAPRPRWRRRRSSSTRRSSAPASTA